MKGAEQHHYDRQDQQHPEHRDQDQATLGPHPGREFVERAGQRDGAWAASACRPADAREFVGQGFEILPTVGGVLGDALLDQFDTRDGMPSSCSGCMLIGSCRMRWKIT